MTVYEAATALGGMMVLGIPEYRLPRALIDREIDAILELGHRRRARLPGRARRHDRGAARAARCRCSCASVPGEGAISTSPVTSSTACCRAVEFLLNVNRGFRVDLGQRVVVVGGGNVAFDAARTALRAAARDEAAPAADDARQPAPHDDARRGLTTTLDAARAALRAGVLDVTVIALESFEEMPADPRGDRGGRGRRHHDPVTASGPHRFVGDGPCDRAWKPSTSCRCSTSDGRFAPVFAPGTEAVLAADTVILAVGQAADLDVLAGVELDASPSAASQSTRRRCARRTRRIWAGGDVAYGPRNLIDAIADGQRAAASIHAVLAGRGRAADRRRVELHRRASFRRLSTGYDAIAARSDPGVRRRDRRVGFAEVETGYDEDDAVLEGLRCLRCFDNIMLDPELCILCGLCVDVCPTDCITIVRADVLGLGDRRSSRRCCSTRTCASAAACASTAAPRGARRWSMPRRLCHE